ncbi:hypothetical protein ACVWYQ_007444 [Bradyrhizobium sp. USDA 3397]
MSIEPPGNVAGVVDEHVDVGGFLRQPGHVLLLAQIDDARCGVDLVRGAQTVGQRLELIAATRREEEMRAFLGEGLGGGCANALGRAGDQDALAAQMQIHGGTRSWE